MRCADHAQPVGTRRQGRRFARGFSLVVACGLVVGAGAGPSPAGAAGRSHGGDWLTYGASMTRDSLQAAGPSLARLQERWRSIHLDGAVYGEPLIASRRVDVATEADSVYSLNAGTGHVLWRRRLGAPVPAARLPCGDIVPTVGVTSTMVLDPRRGELFASGAVLVGGRIHHEVIALAASTGRVQWRRDVDVPGWDAAAQLQRTALALAAGRVVVGFGGNYGDCGNYRGTVVGVPESGHGALVSYRVPTAREGAVWAPSGVSVDGTGTIFFSTGNGSSTGPYDEGDSVVALSPRFTRRGFFAPTNWRQLNETDGDLGSTAPMLLPGHRALVLGKNATAFLLDTRHLGGIGGALASAPACFSIGGDAYRAPLAYVACPNARLTALRVGARSLHVVWRGPAGTTGSPTIAGGLVFVLGGGRLHGLTLESGRQRVNLPVVSTGHLAAPSAGEGLIVVGGTSSVEAFAGSAGWQP